MRRMHCKRIIALALAAAFVLGGSIPSFAEKLDETASTQVAWHPEAPDDISGYAEEIMALVNKEREKAGLGALETPERMQKAANIRAEELDANYSHTRPDGREWHTAWADAGSTLRPRSENIARGLTTPAGIVEAWMASDGHRENILEEGLRFGAVGVYQRDDGSLCWVQLFSKRYN